MRGAKVKPKSVFDFPASELADVVAVKAVSVGDATPDQQKRAVEWIVKNVCLIGDLSFTLDEGPRATDFTEGKRFVANIIMWCAKTPIKEMHSRYPDQLRNPRGENNDRSSA